MGQFIVSARKYRPGSFETLVGQDNIARTLKNSVLNGQLAHAYLFCGPRGVGKTSTARIFAKTINCSNPGPDMEPCGECESCRSFEEGRSYCIHELDAASNNSVDDIRNLTDQVRIPPQIGKYSVYIIDEVHMLSSAAFNAFLKTLEEPPAHAIFILATTEKHKIIPTILSRCQTYDFSRISIEDMVNNMKMIAASENVTISDDALHIIAGKADGAMRDALTLFDQTVAFCGNNITYDQVIKNLNVLDYEYYFKFTDYFLAGDYASALLLFDEVLTKGFNALHFISGLSSHFRDMIVSKNGATKILATLAPSVAAKYDSYSSRCSVKFLYDAMAITTACEAGYKASGNPRLLIEFALMKICQTVVAYENGVQVTKEKSAGQIATPTKPQQTESAKQPEKVTESTTSQQPQQSESQATTQPITPQKAEETVQPQEPAKVSLSIKDILNKTAQESVAKKEEDAKQTDSPITDDSLKTAWNALIATLDKQPALAAELRNNTPEYNPDNNTITQIVSNDQRREFIEAKWVAKFDAFLRNNLGNSNLHVILKVIQKEDTAPKPYMPSEKAREILKNNEGARDLQDKLGLDIC